KQEYKLEAFELFRLMQERIRHDATRVLMTVRIETPEAAEQVEEIAPPAMRNVSYTHADFDEVAGAGDGPAEDVALALQQRPETEEAAAPQPIRRGQKIGRNDPCPCGSGKKYKHCHGKLN